MAKRILDMLKWHPEMNVKNTRLPICTGELEITVISCHHIERLEGGFMIMFDIYGSYHRIVK